MANYVYAVMATAYPRMDVVSLHANVEKQAMSLKRTEPEQSHWIPCLGVPSNQTATKPWITSVVS
jgi:hypothetical protein